MDIEHFVRTHRMTPQEWDELHIQLSPGPAIPHPVTKEVHDYLEECNRILREHITGSAPP